MSVLPVGFGGGRPPPFNVVKSVRFRSISLARAARTFVTPTNASVYTYSIFVKRSLLGGPQSLFSASNNTSLEFTLTDNVQLILNGTTAATSTAYFRDPSAHYHVVYQQNGASQTIWVNNVSVASGTLAAAIFNTAVSHQIGAVTTTRAFDGYLSNIVFVDGQALTPAAFGEFDPINGVWIPKAYTGTYGANGFYLSFAAGTSLTALFTDNSPNGNNWTPTNISLTAGIDYDWMDDTPTNNFPTMSPLDVGTTGAANFGLGNLRLVTSVTGFNAARGTLFVNTGKWYWEVLCSNIPGLGIVGILQPDANLVQFVGQNAQGASYISNGNKAQNNVQTAYGATYTNGDVISVLLDLDAGQLTFWKNGATQGVAYTGISGFYTSGLSDGSVAAGSDYVINYGQTPFLYSPPSGFLPLSAQNAAPITPISSGTFTGNANVNGPFVWLGGTPAAMTINGNAVTFGTHADRLANGIKLRTSSASYNAAGSNTFSVSSFTDRFTDPNRAKGNP